MTQCVNPLLLRNRISYLDTKEVGMIIYIYSMHLAEAFVQSDLH